MHGNRSAEGQCFNILIWNYLFEQADIAVVKVNTCSSGNALKMLGSDKAWHSVFQHVRSHSMKRSNSVIFWAVDGEGHLMMRRTYQNAFEQKVPDHIKMPKPEQFGLDANFNARASLETANKHERWLKYGCTGVGIAVCFICLFIVAHVIWGGESEQSVAANPWTIIGTAVWAVVFQYPVSEWLVAKAKPIFRVGIHLDEQSYVDALSAYREKVSDWNERQTEAGRTYWKEQRGVAFEEAVKALLARRGCTVQTTKGSGDGGVDLIAMFGGSTFWCQCKGHASPVGVAVVREIAGVCSRGGGVPVVIAVNGYTKSAVETAEQLGVLLIDTHNLVNMAKQQCLTQWN